MRHAEKFYSLLASYFFRKKSFPLVRVIHSVCILCYLFKQKWSSHKV